MRVPHLFSYPGLLATDVLITLSSAGCAPEGTTAPSARPAFQATITPDEPVPFYALILRPVFPGAKPTPWAGVTFYRPPSCIPADFNLVDVLDIPGAFSCLPQTVTALTIRKDPSLPNPFQALLHGLGAVPFWLVTSADMEAALADGVLTLPDQEAVPSLVKGRSTVYNEMIQFRSLRQRTLVASGQLDDGRSFHIDEGGKLLVIDVR